MRLHRILAPLGGAAIAAALERARELGVEVLDEGAFLGLLQRAEGAGQAQEA